MLFAVSIILFPFRVTSQRYIWSIYISPFKKYIPVSLLRTVSILLRTLKYALSPSSFTDSGRTSGNNSDLVFFVGNTIYSAAPSGAIWSGLTVASGPENQSGCTVAGAVVGGAAVGVAVGGTAVGAAV